MKGNRKARNHCIAIFLIRQIVNELSELNSWLQSQRLGVQFSIVRQGRVSLCGLWQSAQCLDTSRKGYLFSIWKTLKRVAMSELTWLHTVVVVICKHQYKVWQCDVFLFRIETQSVMDNYFRLYNVQICVSQQLFVIWPFFFWRNLDFSSSAE